MINVALIGYGYWGSKLARNFQNSEYFNLIAIVDKDKKKLKVAKKNFQHTECLKSANIVFNYQNIDLIIISTPTSTHYKLASNALNKSKNVLVEKPLSLSVKQVKNLEKLSRFKKKKIFVDYPFLFAGSINYIKNIISKNKFGPVMSIESFREQAPIRKDANVLWDLGTHDISILNYWLKKPPNQIRSIKTNNLKLPNYDSIYISLNYSKKINVLIKNSWISPTKIRLIKIKFKNAIVYCDENESLYKIKIYKKNNKKDWTRYKLEIPNLDHSEPLSKLAEYIHDSLKTNTNKLFENNFNVKITTLLERIEKSS